ncbi:MAG: hypothetical protein K1X91_12560 [Bacteriodetes bacterium]|nr:hypothetical protein [Bacteroidota bacterium]
MPDNNTNTNTNPCTPPDGTQPKLSDECEKSLVTEQIKPMGKYWRNLLIVFFMMTGIFSSLFIIEYLPTAQQLTKDGNLVDSLVIKSAYLEKLKVDVQKSIDSVKASNNSYTSAFDSLMRITLIEPVQKEISDLTKRVAESTKRGEESKKDITIWFGKKLTIPQLIYLIVFFAGALGGSIHGITSLAQYIGSRRLFDSWKYWYVIKPIAGGMGALAFVLVFSIGFVKFSDGTTENRNIEGITAIAILVGLVTDLAVKKLAMTFSTLFGIEKEKDSDGSNVTGKGTPASGTPASGTPGE